ncbi:conserved hypothetical protein [Neospora caninum Liverpool]|nr:conserved hypothetical protein [Neospora caninum Liverpool]CBZ52092.1 conserved hypothetical protein [Neospora caninum Liverpool]|eukprot:XP_003882124.1 conserved hypothetical protein [Neospora caninum Liverpool]
MRKEVERPYAFFPLVSFFSRAARSGLVHANALHLLVNLRGISQIFPLCEKLCYDALFGAYSPSSSSPFSLFSLSECFPFLSGQGVVWMHAWKEAGRESCLSALSTEQEGDESGERRWCSWRERGKRGPGFGREGWLTRLAVLALFFSGTVAGNFASLVLRRWWSRVEWSVEKQTRDEAQQRRFWGGKVSREDIWREQMDIADAEKPRKNVDVWERHRRLEKLRRPGAQTDGEDAEDEADALNRERETDRSWCVRTLGCSAGLYALLGTLVGSARIHSNVKKKVCGQIVRRILTELFAPVGSSGLDEPGHIGGFLFGYLVAGILGW